LTIRAIATRVVAPLRLRMRLPTRAVVEIVPSSFDVPLKLPVRRPGDVRRDGFALVFCFAIDRRMLPPAAEFTMTFRVRFDSMVPVPEVEPPQQYV